MADAIREALDTEVTLIAGGRGIFEVAVDGDVVAKKTLDGFPTPEQCVAGVSRALQ